MKFRKIVGATFVVAALLASTASAVTAAGGGQTTFYVSCPQSTCTGGDQVTVKAQAYQKFQTRIETCTKPVDPDHCVGSLHSYHRAYAGAPWYIDL